MAKKGAKTISNLFVLGQPGACFSCAGFRLGIARSRRGAQVARSAKVEIPPTTRPPPRRGSCAPVSPRPANRSQLFDPAGAGRPIRRAAIARRRWPRLAMKLPRWARPWAIAGGGAPRITEITRASGRRTAGSTGKPTIHPAPERVEPVPNSEEDCASDTAPVAASGRDRRRATRTRHRRTPWRRFRARRRDFSLLTPTEADLAGGPSGPHAV